MTVASAKALSGQPRRFPLVRRTTGYGASYPFVTRLAKVCNSAYERTIECGNAAPR